MSAYGSCSTHGNTEPCFLVSKRAQLIPMEGRYVSDDELELECDDDINVCDDNDVTGTNGEASNADGDGAVTIHWLHTWFIWFIWVVIL